MRFVFKGLIVSIALPGLLCCYYASAASAGRLDPRIAFQAFLTSIYMKIYLRDESVIRC